MKSKLFFLCLFILCCNIIIAQAQSFDVFNYTEPPGWKKELTKNAIRYTISDETKGSYCIMTLYQSTASAGSLQKDFDNKWQALAVTGFNVTNAPSIEKGKNINDWETMSGVSSFTQSNGTAVIMITALTGFEKTAGIIFITNDQAYIPRLLEFTKNLQLAAPQNDTLAETKTGETSGGSIIGEWSSNSSTAADFVTASGQYAGDASIASTTIFVFNANGTYEERFNIYLRSKFHFFTYKGNYTTTASQLTLKPIWYQHKVNAKEVQDNNANNMKVNTYNFSIFTDTEKNKPALKLTCNWQACVSPDNLYKIKK